MSESNFNESVLSYFISENGPYCIVTFVGNMTNSTTLSLLSCHREVELKTAKYVVIYFRDVRMINGDAVQILASLQKAIRLKPADLRLCGMSSNIKERLQREGVVRSKELWDTLPQALQSFRPM